MRKLAVSLLLLMLGLASWDAVLDEANPQNTSVSEEGNARAMSLDGTPLPP